MGGFAAVTTVAVGLQIWHESQPKAIMPKQDEIAAYEGVMPTYHSSEMEMINLFACNTAYIIIMSGKTI